MTAYQEYIAQKKIQHLDAGFVASGMLWPLKDFQVDAVKWACRRGRAALFADTGLGKTLMQLAWAYLVVEHTDKPVLVVTPLCVAQQAVREGEKFGIDCKYIREPKLCNARIHVTNYEMLKNFDPDNYAGIVLELYAAHAHQYLIDNPSVPGIGVTI